MIDFKRKHLIEEKGEGVTFSAVVKGDDCGHLLAGKLTRIGNTWTRPGSVAVEVRVDGDGNSLVKFENKQFAINLMELADLRTLLNTMGLDQGNLFGKFRIAGTRVIK